MIEGIEGERVDRAEWVGSSWRTRLDRTATGL